MVLVGCATQLSEPLASHLQKKEGDVDLDTPLPPLKLTKYVYDYDETAAKPFLFFDSSAVCCCFPAQAGSYCI